MKLLKRSNRRKGSTKIISTVRVLGVRNTGAAAAGDNEDTALYSLMLVYTDGTRELLEVGTGQMDVYLPYIPV